MRWFTTTSREGADRIVEVSTVLDPEVLRHRDLHALDVVPVPDRLEHGVAEAEIEDLLESHLPEVVVDAQELRFVDVLVQLFGECLRGREIVPERLLDHDTGVLGEPGAREALDDRPEQEGRDLQVEHGAARPLDRCAHALVGGVVTEVARDVAEPTRQASKRLLVELLAGSDDGGPRSIDELVDAPVVDGNSDDGTVEQLALLEPVQRAERHDLRQVPRDPEDHEDIATRLLAHALQLPRGLRRAFEQVVADPYGVRHRGQSRVHCADAGEEARVDHVQVVELVGLAVLVQHRRRGIAPEAARAGLVRASATGMFMSM